MKKFIVLLLSCFLIFMVGCSKGNQEKDNLDKQEKIEVTILTPEKINPNAEISIEALVTQEGEKIEDADEVQFEIGKSGQDEKEMINGKQKGNGVYSAKYTFKEDGTYNIVAHVTARDMMDMPQKEVIVGKPENAEGDLQQHQAGEGEPGNQDENESDISIDFTANETILVNKDITLSANIKTEKQPFNEARVRFEIWHENEEKHEFIETTEISSGKYNLTKKFATPGIYHVKVHYEKDDIHGHQEESIEVK